MQRIVFCDFDGTITSEETFVAMLKHFAPDLSSQILPEMYALRLTLREGVRQILESIPSARYPEIIEFACSKSMRPGLVELLDFLEGEGVPFVVISGGIRCMVEAVLGDLVNRIESIYAVDLDTTDEKFRVISAFEGDTELMAKVDVMSRYPGEAIAIGDSVTDLNMALTAPVVFARDRLAKYLDERKKVYIPWQDFLDIRDYLRQAWQSSSRV